ncbi:ABC transporter ATP-binding protein [Bergeyella sp. RCAD1439]|uniref:ABC transporter ATP-binding protein n=1 Tax=Bergeyella anatis TaxID=3113737 RepID=UPI002E1734B3|nr:ABC transporter ATP-binding protein [Bergeyella sp. RCAD1439]
MLLEIKNLHFAYSPEKKLFTNLNLRIGKGKIVALAGESGCGKSTLLSLIYGLYDWDQGSIIFEGTPLMGPKGNIVPGEQNMKFVAQNYDLMPYSTVYDNVGKYLSNIDLKAKRNHVMELLELVDLTDYADVKPKFLSGGQQQRVAIARALSVLPKMLLLDEPFSNLDFPRKIELREKLFGYAKKHDIAIIISTHDIQEIMPWLDQIIILQDGRLIQNDSPEETYLAPYNDYVAKLFGEVNILTEAQQRQLNAPKRYLFPEDLELSENGLNATVTESRFAGSHYRTRISCQDIPLLMHSPTALSGNITLKFRTL